jgi:hypothetical protein
VSARSSVCPIDDLHPRELVPLDRAVGLDEFQMPVGTVSPGGSTRQITDEHAGGAGHPRSRERDLAGVVPRAAPLLIGRVGLILDDDEPQPWERSEDRSPLSHHHPDEPLPGPQERAVALRGRALAAEVHPVRSAKTQSGSW